MTTDTEIKKECEVCKRFFELDEYGIFLCNECIEIVENKAKDQERRRILKAIQETQENWETPDEPCCKVNIDDKSMGYCQFHGFIQELKSKISEADKR